MPLTSDDLVHADATFPYPPFEASLVLSRVVAADGSNELRFRRVAEGENRLYFSADADEASAFAALVEAAVDAIGEGEHSFTYDGPVRLRSMPEGLESSGYLVGGTSWSLVVERGDRAATVRVEPGAEAPQQVQDLIRFLEQARSASEEWELQSPRQHFAADAIADDVLGF